MFSWFLNKAETLQPLRLSQREKSYSAAAGHVYQYIFKGFVGKRHVFQVTVARRDTFPVSIELTEEALKSCAERMGSPLRWNEQYALAKLCLFEAFDNADQPESLKQPIVASTAGLLEHMTTLNLA